MNNDNFVPSTLKVTASKNLDIENDLKKEDSEKTLNKLLNEQKEQD